MKFAKVTLKCLGCKAAIKDSEKTLCEHCQVCGNTSLGLPQKTSGS